MRRRTIPHFFRALRGSTLAVVIVSASVCAVSSAPQAAGATGSATAAGNTVTDGDTRFTVESPTLIRTEYAGDGAFQNSPTFTAVNRSMPTPAFTWSASGGYLTITSAALTLRYQEGSGPFNGSNLTVTLMNGSQQVTAHPSFSGGCDFGSDCEAEGLSLSGGASVDSNHTEYTGSGFVGGFQQAGAAIGWQEAAVASAGQYAVQLRYANASGGDGKDEARTVTLTANGVSTQVTLPTTADWNTWAVSTTTVTLPAGTSPMSISCGTSDSCNVNIDSVAVTPIGAAYPSPAANANLGGYRNSLDTQSGPAPMADGVLSRDGWYLLNDTTTGLLNSDGTVTPRPSHNGQPYQDGYFFGYGQNYKQALLDLRNLTGPAPLLPRSAFGVWYSEYNAYSMSDYQNTLIPAFRANKVPIDQLVTDTDWKAPNGWDGWEFNSQYFPDPKALFTWEASQGIQPVLNIHPSISTSDPRYPAILAIAGTLTSTSCYDGPCEVFDMRDPKQAQAYFNLHSTIENNDGQPIWWLDASSGETATPNVDVSPDSYISAQYKAHADALGQRGYVLARIGGTDQGYGTFTPGVSGAWADHRSAVNFTGDTYPTWAMLAFESQYTAIEGAGVGEPYVTHDIGGFEQSSADASGGYDDPDLYARWVQLGAFQPILRLHSDHGHRLPWDYDSSTTPAAYYSPAATASAEKFLQLREALVPYTYSLAQQATTTGLPIVRALYLNWPQYDQSYNSSEYTYGDDVLVAPVTTPGTGTVTQSVWFPPGSWTDYFTGQTYTGPGTAQIQTTLATMPVFLRAGGIMTTRTDYVDSANASPMTQVTIDAATGANGSFSLYEDDGKSTSYQTGASATTAITYADSTHTLTIAPMSGTYTGAVANRTWTVKLHNVAAAPTAVTVNGATPATSSYDPTSRVLTVTTTSLPANATTTVNYTAAGAAVSGAIVGTGSSRCVDVPNANTADYTQLQVYDCDGTTAQTWTLQSDGTIRALGKCMDVDGAQTANGTTVQLYDCNGTGAQVWQPQADGALLNPQSGKCLDDTASGGPGTQLIIYDCTGGANQTWTQP